MKLESPHAWQFVGSFSTNYCVGFDAPYREELPLYIFDDPRSECFQKTRNPAELHGGPGKDPLYGGFNNDELFGDEGRDLLLGAYGGDDIIRGGDGNDLLRGSFGNDILLGEAGRDRLYGNVGRNVLLGGSGGDRLEAGLQLGPAGDVLISGLTDHDNNDEALLAILTEWSSTRSLDDRIANLTAGVGGASGNEFALTLGGTVHNDDSWSRLVGGEGRDWFFKFRTDILHNFDPAEDEVAQ